MAKAARMFFLKLRESVYGKEEGTHSAVKFRKGYLDFGEQFGFREILYRSGMKTSG
jgi:hypothetical protein